MILVLVASTPANAPEVEVVLEATKASDEVEECKDGVKDLKNGIEGLEFFLNDKKSTKSIDVTTVNALTGLGSSQN